MKKEVIIVCDGVDGVLCFLGGAHVIFYCSLSSCATSYCAVPPDDHILLSLRSATSSSFRSSSVYHLHLALVYSRIAVSVRYRLADGMAA